MQSKTICINNSNPYSTPFHAKQMASIYQSTTIFLVNSNTNYKWDFTYKLNMQKK